MIWSNFSKCHFRGYTVRSKLKQLQKNFEGIVHDLDGHDFHVVWLSNKERLSLPLMVTNEDRSKNKDVEDRTLTQDVCDKIDDISALNPRNHQLRLRDISDSPHHLFHDHIKRNLFDETISDKERNSTHSSKTAPIDNDMSHVQVGEVHDMSHPEAGENDNTSHPRSDKDIKVNHQEGHEIMINGSPCRVDEQMYTCHSTPVSSDDTECNDRAMRRHPLLTDSWMTDKSFGKYGFTHHLLEEISKYCMVWYFSATVESQTRGGCYLHPSLYTILGASVQY